MQGTPDKERIAATEVGTLEQGRMGRYVSTDCRSFERNLNSELE
jgi:hypothetical protein